MRWQLLSDFKAYAERRLLDSRVGSGGPEVKTLTFDEVDELLAVIAHLQNVGCVDDLWPWW